MKAPPGPGSSPLYQSELLRRREQIHRGLRRANLAALIVLLIVVGLAIGAIVQALRAERNSREAHDARGRAEEKTKQAQQAEARALLEQARARRQTDHAGHRLESLTAISQAVAIEPNADLRNEAIAALALSDVQFIPIYESTNPYLVAQLSPDFEHIAIGLPSGDIRISRVSDSRQEVLLPSSGSKASRLYYSPNGRLLAVEDFAGSNNVWEAASGKRIMHLTPGFSFSAFTPDDKELFACSDSGKLICQALDDGHTIWEQEVGDALATVFADPKGDKIVSLIPDENEAQVRKVDDGALLYKIVGTSDTGTIAWSPDGRRLFVGRENGWIEQRDAESGIMVSQWKGHDDVVVNLALTSDGERLASSSWDASARFWQLPGSRLEVSAEGYDAQNFGCFSQDGSRYATIQAHRTWGYLDVARSEVLRKIAAPPSGARGAWSLDVTRDGRLMVVGSSDFVRIYDFDSGKEMLSYPGEFRSVKFTADGHSFISAGKPGLLLWPLIYASGRTTTTVSLGQPRVFGTHKGFTELEITPDGSQVVAPSVDTDSVFIYAITNSTEFEFEKHDGVQHVAVSPNGRWLASGTWKGRGVRIYELATRRLVRELPVTDSATLAFSPDSRLLVVGSRAQQIWETGTWRESYRRAELDNVIPPCAFSPDGRLLALTERRTKIELIAPEGGRSLAELDAPDAKSISAMKFSSDGRYLVVLEFGRGIQIWDMANLHRGLAKLGLDWNDDQAERGDITSIARPRILAGTRPQNNPEDSPAHILPVTAAYSFYALALGLVLSGVVVGAYTLRYNYRMIQNYEEVEDLVSHRNEELKSARMELLHGQKMRALGTLAAGIAHDFNNLLSVIRMSNKLIERQARDREGIREHVTDVEQAVLQGKSLVGSMLGYARNEDGTSGPTDVKTVVEQAVALLSREFLSGIELILDLDKNAPQVELGRGRLEQVLLNLIVNASEAMRGHGKLKITSRAHAGAPSLPYVLKAQPAEQFVELNVIDSGPGIAPEIGERLFEPFFTTKTEGAKPGTGLGLSLVYSIARDDKLGLSFQSRLGEGATFTLLIPACAQDAQFTSAKRALN